MQYLVISLLSFSLLTFLTPASFAAKKPPVTTNENGEVISQKALPQEAAKNANSEYDMGAQMGLPNYNGTGCPNGSISATLSPDNKTLSIIFDSFLSEAATATKDLKNCRMKIPVKVSPGFQVMVVKSDLRGFTSLPDAATTVVRTSHSISAAQNGKEKELDKKPFVRITTYTGPIDEEIYVGQHIEKDETWSPCGAHFALNVGTQVTVSNSKSPETAMAVVDSLDIQSQDKAMKYHLNWRRCKPQISGAGGGSGHQKPIGKPK